MTTVLILLGLWTSGSVAVTYCIHRAAAAAVPTPPQVPDHLPAEWSNTCGCDRHAPASWVPAHVPAEWSDGAR